MTPLLFIAVLLFVVMGAMSQARGDEKTFRKAIKERDFDISASEYQIRIQDLTEIFAGSIENAADDIIASTPDPVVRRHALLWKLSAIPIVYKILYNHNLLMSHIDAWAFSLQLKNYFKSEEGREAFGEGHVLGWQTSVSMETKLVDLAKALHKSRDISVPQEFIQTWSDNHPVRIPVLVRESILPTLSYGVGEKSISTFKAVGQMTEQLDDITNWLTSYANLLPKQARWQTDLLLSEFGTSEKLEILMAELAAVTRVLEQVGEIIEQSPGMITDERKAVVEAFHNERLETLSYLSRERKIVIVALQNERKAVISALQNEREVVLAALQDERRIVFQALNNERRSIKEDIAAAENRMIQDTVMVLDESIDRFFLRAAQLSGALLFICLSAALIVVYVFNKQRKA